MARPRTKFKVNERVEFRFLGTIKRGTIIESIDGVHKIRADDGTIFPHMKITPPKKDPYGHIIGPLKKRKKRKK